MILIACDICRKQINPAQNAPHLCEKHLPVGERFYREQAEYLLKAMEAFRNRFLQGLTQPEKKV